MSSKKTPTQARIDRELADLRRVLEALPPNPISWGAVLTILAPIIARLAVRVALKRIKRGLSEDKVNETASFVAGVIRDVLEKSHVGTGTTL